MASSGVIKMSLFLIYPPCIEISILFSILLPKVAIFLPFFLQVSTICFKRYILEANVAIIILLLLTVKEVWKNSIVDRFTFLIFLGILILSVFGVSPSISIILSAILGILYKKFFGHGEIPGGKE